MSIFMKTGLLALFLFGVISLLASGMTAYILYQRMSEEYLSKGTAIAQSIADASQEILLNRDAATVQAMIDQYLEIEGVAYVFVLDAGGEVVSHTFVPEMPPRLAALHAAKEGDRVDELTVAPFGRVFDICRPILAGVAGYVHVGMDRELIMSYFWNAILKMQGLMFVILLVCVGVLYAITLRISRPLSSLTQYAQRLAARDFSARLDISSRDEVGVLGRTMEDMAGELSVLFADMQSEVDRATSDLREHMAYLSAIIDNLADGLLVVGPTGTVSLLNPAMREFFDLGDKEYEGFSASEVFPVEISEMSSAIRVCGAEVQEAEIPLSRNRVGKAVGTSIYVADPAQCLGGVLLIRDITRAKELDQLKTDFISTVSHELRTPMTSVVGFSKIIRKKLEQTIFPVLDESGEEKRAADQVQENMDIIVSEAERLTELINDVLDIAKMEAGKVQWREQTVSMADVIRQSLDSTRGLWAAKDMEVVVDLEENLPPVSGDRGRLVQVMVNLISNAVKFTDKSPVVCRAHTDGSSLLVSVEDRGVGIPPESQEEIFDKFKQVGDTLTAKPTGTGLGLPICRQIVEHHGGRIWVESEEGKGSIFYFNLPITRVEHLSDEAMLEECERILPSPESAMLVREETAGAPPLILVVDDDPILGRFLTQVFESAGFRVRVAVNGEQAVELASDLLPSLITMDLMMPGMDGRTAIRCLRHNPFTRQIPILVLSALTEGVNAGGDVALTKPVDDVRLLEVATALLLEKNMRRSCLVIGDIEDEEMEEFKVICPENVTFCSLDTIWNHVDQGFKGTIFIPAEVESEVDIERLSRVPDVAVVILPVLPGRRGSQAAG
jgi:signal transduction histidine kinase/ActR/RegA family two-component response regulator/HAMP domain-containing protein